MSDFSSQPAVHASPPRKCSITQLGLLVLVAVAGLFLYIGLHQWYVTGSFVKVDEAWASPRWARLAMLYGIPVALGVLLIGSILDTIRYTRWKRGLAPSSPADID